MPPTIEVKAGDAAVKTERKATACRVVKKFGNMLPEARLLCFFDDQDWDRFKQAFGDANRGLYWPMGRGGLQGWPSYVKKLVYPDLTVEDLKPGFEHITYLHGSASGEEVGLAMTFAHELHHFRQYMNTPLLWAAGSLILELNKETLAALGWQDWADVPHEREARIVAKQITADIFGAHTVQEFIASRICVAADRDRRDWEFISEIGLSDRYDLAAGTRAAYQHLNPYRAELGQLLEEKKKNPAFTSVDLAEFLS